MTRGLKFLLIGAGALTAALSLGVSAVSQAPKEVVIGASVPLSGPLATFGLYQKWGYETAIKDLNAKGGLKLGATRVPVRLVTYDDESRPEKTAENTERLITKDGVNALLSSATPPLVITGAVVAEREGVPMVATISPIRAFLGANQAGWKWTHDIFFDELKMTDQQFLTLNTVKTNKKIALFTDNEQDGVVMGGLWTEKAAKFGYKIVYHAKFPVGTNEYGDLIRKAQEAGAEAIICQMIPPDSIALWKQMKSLKYTPKAIFFEKGSETFEWWQALGPTAQGTMIAGFWHPNLPYPGAKELVKRFETETKAVYGQLIASTYTAAQVLLDGIERAGTLEGKAIDDAVQKTNKIYVLGRVKFTEGPGARAASTQIFMLQWQDGVREIVFPRSATTKPIIFPLTP
jgi:branched-chain amino acid transport system substrate-binding protein